MQQIFRCALALMLLAASGSTAFAQATRTWVSGVGDDANPCSRTAPCKTFAGAISKTAAGGVISVLDPGGFGAVTITKAITIDGGGVEGSILGAAVTGVIVNTAAADEVVLRNLTISGVGTGTQGVRVINSSGNVTIVDCAITGFNIGVDHNSPATLQVYDTLVSDNRSFGVIVRQGRATLDNLRLDNNVSDAVRAAGGSRVVVRRSTATGHTNVGFYAVASSTLAVEDSTSSNNAWGIGSHSGSTVTVSNSLIMGSSVAGLYREGVSVLLTYGNNRLVGNVTDGTFSGTATLR
jgi:Right handed beta helix region